MTKNLLLISLDTLRADVAYSGRFPTIERLRSRGTTFLTTVSSSPLTPISHASVFTGLQPQRHGIRHLLRERLGDVPTLAELLHSAGYRTGAVVSCPGLNRWYGLDRGFDAYDDEIPPLADGRNAVEVADVELRGTALKRAPLVTERASAWMRSEASSPWMLFVHYFDSHWPYEPPDDVGVPVANPYEGEVAFMDHHLGRFLDGAVGNGLDLDDTLVVLFSDHGEDLGGWYPDDHAGEQGHREEKGHGALLFDTTQLVPLVICDPGAPEGGEVREQVRLIDVMPTVLDLLGVPAPAVDGRSLAPAVHGGGIEESPAYCETFYREELAEADPEWSHLLPLKAVRTPAHKTIWENGSDRVEIFDLVTDAYEKSPLIV
jgi:arylsulfatase